MEKKKENKERKEKGVDPSIIDFFFKEKREGGKSNPWKRREEREE